MAGGFIVVGSSARGRAGELDRVWTQVIFIPSAASAAEGFLCFGLVFRSHFFRIRASDSHIFA